MFADINVRLLPRCKLCLASLGLEMSVLPRIDFDVILRDFLCLEKNVLIISLPILYCISLLVNPIVCVNSSGTFLQVQLIHSLVCFLIKCHGSI